MQPMKVYVAGKMSGHSGYNSHTWRDDFLREISKPSGLKFISFDPTDAEKDYEKPELVFGSDAHMISEVDVVVVYFSDDISVGGSQEILIAKYFGKPVIGFAPYGGKFNGGAKLVAGTTIKDYKHPFVFATCDVVCGDIAEVAETLKNIGNIKPKTIRLIDEAKEKFEKTHNERKLYTERYIN